MPECPACQSSEPIYESGCPGCEARALTCFDRNRMERALAGESVPIPSGLAPKEIVEFILDSINKGAGMTKDDVIRMAENADKAADERIQCPGEFHPDWHEVRDEIFAQLVAAHERELCARLCEDRLVKESADHLAVLVFNGAIEKCASAIRNRGNA